MLTGRLEEARPQTHTETPSSLPGTVSPLPVRAITSQLTLLILTREIARERVTEREQSPAQLWLLVLLGLNPESRAGEAAEPPSHRSPRHRRHHCSQSPAYLQLTWCWSLNHSLGAVESLWKPCAVCPALNQHTPNSNLIIRYVSQSHAQLWLPGVLGLEPGPWRAEPSCCLQPPLETHKLLCSGCQAELWTFDANFSCHITVALTGQEKELRVGRMAGPPWLACGLFHSQAEGCIWTETDPCRPAHHFRSFSPAGGDLGLCTLNCLRNRPFYFKLTLVGGV